jgi:ABC-type glutathione transport system ATPase component
MSTILEVRDLVKGFGRVAAVRGVSFSIEAGTTYGLVGESGSGKTTVARMVARLARPDAGRLLFEGQDVARLRGRRLRAFRTDVQMIFQDPYSALNPRMDVLQLISEPWQVHCLHSPREWRARAVALLDQVGLPAGSLERRPGEFSGGQRQRIMIARALALGPRLIVADEPVSALDVSVQAQVLDLLKDLQDELGVSYLFISHDLAVVEFVSDRIGVMRRGELIEEGGKRDIYRAPREAYTRELLAAIPELPAARP